MATINTILSALKYKAQKCYPGKKIEPTWTSKKIKSWPECILVTDSHYQLWFNIDKITHLVQIPKPFSERILHD